MTRKKIVNKAKITKDDLDPSKDEFVTKSMSFLDWAVERRKQIGVLLGIALVASVAGIVIVNKKEADAAKASQSLALGLDASIAPIIETSDEDGVPAQTNDDFLSFENTGARTTETLKLLDEAIAKNKDNPISKYAELVKASALFEKGETDNAISLYEAFLASQSSPQIGWLTQNALEGLAVALESAGKLDVAKEKYKKLAEISTGRMALWAKYNEARIAQKKGEDMDGVIAALKDVVTQISEEGEGSGYDYLFVEARSRLLSLDPEADVPEMPSQISPELLQQLMRAQQAGAGDVQ